MPTTTMVKIFAERYRHLSERILSNKEGLYQKLQEFVHLVSHDAATSPEQEGKLLLEALKTGDVVRPRYYTIARELNWQEVTSTTFADT